MSTTKANSHKTARSRSKLSAPASYLKSRGLIRGNVLDYGSGLGTDAALLQADAYDPYYQPRLPTCAYDTILCTYVLNTIPGKGARASIIRNVRKLLKPGGIAYFTIRSDMQALNGWTKRGTWQGYVGDDLCKYGRKIGGISGRFEVFAVKPYAIRT